MSFSYFVIYSTNDCKVGKNFKVSLNSYDNNGNCLLKEEKKEFAFLCKKCCEINFINSDLIINKETLKFTKKIEIEKKYHKVLDEFNKFEIN